MIKDTLAERIRDFKPANLLEQESILQELMQDFVLASLARARFFSVAGFHGGTCLRILHGLNRFSEDLDFLLMRPDSSFRWSGYFDSIRKDFSEEGIRIEVQDRSDTEAAVKKAFIKTDSIGQILTLELPFTRHQFKKLRIKLEIDSNPPAGSHFETRYIHFPTLAAVAAQTLESGFANKSHAILCRKYTKGRDWYDFLWYIIRRVVPDYNLIANALYQQGPWAGKKIPFTTAWYVETLRKKINETDWDEARQDVVRFVVSREQESIELWNAELFLYHVDRLAEYLEEHPGQG
jgi:predicted nucleotidyltransferase component of viral defense system